MTVRKLLMELLKCPDLDRRIYVELPAEGARLVEVQGIHREFRNYTGDDDGEVVVNIEVG